MTLIREAEGDYYLVTLPDGREGYILKGYVTEQIPPAHQVRLLEDQVAKQNQELARLREENTLLQATQEAIQQNKAEYTAQIQNPDAGSGINSGVTLRYRVFLPGQAVLLLLAGSWVGPDSGCGANRNTGSG